MACNRSNCAELSGKICKARGNRGSKGSVEALKTGQKPINSPFDSTDVTTKGSNFEHEKLYRGFEDINLPGVAGKNKVDFLIANGFEKLTLKELKKRTNDDDAKILAKWKNTHIAKSMNRPTFYLLDKSDKPSDQSVKTFDLNSYQSLVSHKIEKENKMSVLIETQEKRAKSNLDSVKNHLSHEQFKEEGYYRERWKKYESMSDEEIIQEFKVHDDKNINELKKEINDINL